MGDPISPGVLSGCKPEQRKDRRRVDIGNIGPTEDAAMRRFAVAVPVPLTFYGRRAVRAWRYRITHLG
jgi:hypothetical protein